MRVLMHFILRVLFLFTLVNFSRKRNSQFSLIYSKINISFLIELTVDLFLNFIFKTNWEMRKFKIYFSVEFYWINFIITVNSVSNLIVMQKFKFNLVVKIDFKIYSKNLMNSTNLLFENSHYISPAEILKLDIFDLLHYRW